MHRKQLTGSYNKFVHTTKNSLLSYLNKLLQFNTLNPASPSMVTACCSCLKAVNKFTYLGSTLSRNVIIDDEVDARLAKANSAFGRLSKNVWNRRGITLETKIKVYRAAVMTTLLYGSETWTVYRCHAAKLNQICEIMKL